MRRFFAITSALILASSAWAQEANEGNAEPANQPAAEQDDSAQAGAGQARASTPQEITRAVHGDWQIRCVTTEPQQCYLYQLIVNERDVPLMEYSLVPAKDETGQDVRLVGTLITPLNTVLGRGVILQVDENNPVQKDYSWCAPIGCFARFPVNGTELKEYQSGSKVTAVLFMMQNPRSGLELDLSLSGFGAAYDELMEIEAEQKS